MKKNILKLNEICLKKEPLIKPYLNDRLPSFDHIIAWIYLLPLADPTEEQYNLASGFLFLQISRDCHESVKEEDGVFNSEAVLLGDLFVTHTYQRVLSNEKRDLLAEVADIVGQSNEAWFTLQGISISDETAVKKAIDNELGLILKKCAKKGGEDAGWTEEKIIAYQNCAEEIAYLWGHQRHNLTFDTQKAKNDILKLAKEMEIEAEICEILSLFS